MKIDGNELMSNSISSKSSNTDIQKAISTIGKPERVLTTTKSISQINNYDKDNMPVSERVVIEAIQKANKAISGGNRRFEFSIHEKTNEIVVKVFDSETNELIREIPNEKVLDMVAKICEMAGILVDERR
ncbi:flagellar protein FlaG protein [Ruminiclostridium papyrosolvens DSM 2782]|uniref:Flagellar protein FlaG protein n=1 Tax=Ruminiclostridium papyrosolvens DSM 2782 TaxID=588581 RepID=F1TCQ3_9FIRM|nr:flagellar protein FlaG [Ruminiclostridium papyrosolvens]EGD47770.1 flagellar protein FlaG protein [Ruminiclostridium papyrosolvens DSM 2782]WES34487.1 flagellar protein FlaG [Ruminiclostridium papyrosolvens DSM 2782]